MTVDISSQTFADTAADLVAAVSSGDDETALVVQARNGSVVAIEQLVRRYENRLFRLARNITGNYEDAEEVVQNAFIKALYNLDAFRGDSRFYTWLVRITVNEALMKTRGRRFTQVPIDHADEGEDQLIPRQLEDWGPNPEQRYSQEEQHRILETTISELDPGYRTVFQLRDVEGFSTEETARTLSLSVTTVKTRLRRARLQLRNLLDGYFRPTKRTVSSGTGVAFFNPSFRGWRAARRRRTAAC